MNGDSSPVAETFSCTLLDPVSDLLVVFDTAGAFTHWNRAVPEATGYTDEALSSLSADDLFADAATLDERVAAAESNGEPFDATVITADGDRLDYEFTVTAHGDTGVSGDTDDVDERAEHVVCVGRETTGGSDRGRDWYRTILESLPDAVYAIEADGTIAYVNEAYAAMKGVPRNDLLGTDVDDWVADETVGRADELRRELDAGARDVGTIEYEFVAGNGERFPAEIRFTRVDDDRFGFSRVGIIRDATERATRERRLQQQNDRLDEFATIASHDLRNPLNVAEGRLELARQEHDSEHLASIERAHDRMRSLIDDLLTLARQREDTLDLTTVSLSTLAEHCWDSVEQSDATLVVETEATVRADESRLQRLLENLFRNSVEHGSTASRSQVAEIASSRARRTTGLHSSPVIAWNRAPRTAGREPMTRSSVVPLTGRRRTTSLRTAGARSRRPSATCRTASSSRTTVGAFLPRRTIRCSRPATRRTPREPASG